MKTDEKLRSLLDTLIGELQHVTKTFTLSSEQSYSVGRLTARASKRMQFQDTDLAKDTMRRFVDLNSSLEGFKTSLSDIDKFNARHFIRVALENYSTSVDGSIQEPLLYDHLFDLWRFGPGTSQGVYGTHAVNKVSAKMTCTSECLPLVRRLRSLDPHFSSFDARYGCGTRVVKGSKLSTVRKNQETDRTIAVEPLGNMCLQLAAGAYLTLVLKHIGLNIENQQESNRFLAWAGSKYNSYATIDLKSASDLISLDLVRAVLPTEWFFLLKSIRSQQIYVDGEWHTMNMISTMGNGFTFPLMTLILVSLVYAAQCRRSSTHNLRVDFEHTAVFGDDIIVPVKDYDDVVEVLTSAGLIVNYDKSYSEGPFRESCGGDYYNGYTCTPFYIKSLVTHAETYVAINQLVGWCVRHNVWLHRTLALLISFIGPRPLLVPEWEDPSHGILTQGGPRRYKCLLPVIPYKKVSRGNYFLSKLAVGGFITSAGKAIVYVPRSERPRVRSESENTAYAIVSRRYPKGYTAGYDPCLGSYQSSCARSRFVSAHV